MLKRILCVLCTLLLLAPFAVADEPQAVSYDFDLTFSLNPDAFPPASRPRAKGYAQMAKCLRLQGNIIWSEKNDSLDMNATLSFRANPAVSIPVHLYGMPSRLYLTSPAVNNEIIMLNMPAFLEFARKAEEQLNVPLPYFAFMYPETTLYPFSGLSKAWRKTIGRMKESCEISPEKIAEVASLWDDELMENEYLILWIGSLSAYSDAPDAVDTEFANLPYYPEEYVTGGKPLTVTVSHDTETWKNAAGQTLSVSTEKEGYSSWTLTLPETENRYKPFLSYEREIKEGGVSLHINGSYIRDPLPEASAEEKPEAETAAVSAPDESSADTVSGGPSVSGEDASADDSEEADEDSSARGEGYYEQGADADEGYQPEGTDWPDKLLEFSLDAEGLPESLPSDSSFTVVASENGALFPDLSFVLKGETKKDGSAVLSFCQPGSGETGAVEVFRCQGTVLPAEPSFVPAYRQKVFQGAYNLFSLNEEKLGRFKQDITPGLVRTMIAFIAESPTAFVQSLLDDLTDLGLMGVFLEQ